ncbi:Hypothetical protein GG9_0935 [Haemophilus haemolyticus M19501]|uniref:Uncharacterized protein n=1 Tax=Haemophilus haemolyticus M19501 TaxID=1028803 RepID=F9GPF0_HAEHA|nr:Hypothetical protein GG9_0935 [Haemophilus haemolyticus M19501]
MTALEAQVPALSVGLFYDLRLASRHERVGSHNQDDWL